MALPKPTCFFKLRPDGTRPCKFCGQSPATWPMRDLPECPAQVNDVVRLTPPPKPTADKKTNTKADARAGAKKLGLIWADARHYARALAKWTAAKFPVRSDAEVKRLLSICEACTEHVKGHCRVCGCRVNRGPAVANKIRMATEDCPKGKWKIPPDKPFQDVDKTVKPKPPSPNPQSPTPNPSTPIDVVYPLGTGSKWGDNELRYSLRSLEKNFPDLGRVFIVGHKPPWLKTGDRLIHIPMPDKHKHNKDANLIDKVLAACEAGVSERFVFCSDDQLFLQPIRFAEMAKPLHGGNLQTKPEKFWGDGSWKKRLKATRDVLQERGFSVFHYDTHCPTPYHREAFVKVAKSFDYAPPPGYTINTLYVNAAGMEGEPVNGRKLTLEKANNDAADIRNRMKRRMFLGYSNAGLTVALKQVLKEMFSEKSRFEMKRPQPKRGIITLAGGPIYFINAYINCRLLRHMGCSLPIEWYYLGDEMSSVWLSAIRDTIANVRLIDLGGHKTNNTKRRGGWQAKVEAILRSKFDELLFLDADSFPRRDPSFLFDHPLFATHDCILWPDIGKFSKDQQNLLLKKHNVKIGRQPVESGQMMFRKETCLEGLRKARAINQNSRVVYRYLHGDKDTFQIGMRQAKANWAIVPHRVRRDSERNLVQHDFDGNPLFTHLTRGKWKPDTQAIVGLDDYPHHAEAVRIYNKLKHDGIIYDNPPPSQGSTMKVRDSFCATEALRIIHEDSYKIRPMIGHRIPVKYIVDIGGNAGGFTIAASNAYPDAEIIVIEPDPELMEDLKHNTRKCLAKIHYVEKACIGTEADSVPFVRFYSARGGNFVKGGHWKPNIEQGEATEFQVPSMTLPKLLAECGFPSIDILKIDAEGVEGEILMSLKKTGWMSRVHWIRGEWHGRADWPLIKEALRETHEFRLQPTPDNGEMIAHNLADT